MQSRNHADTHHTVKRFKRCGLQTVSHFECCKCAIMTFHCANGLVVLRICCLP